MSAFWHWFIVILTIGSILGCLWLIWWAAQKHQTESASGEPVGHVWDDDLSEMDHPMPRWWLWLFYATILFSFAYLLLYPGLGNFPGLLGWTQEGQHAAEVQALEERRDAHLARYADMDVEALAANADAVQAGARIYAHNCAICHGSDARGAPGFPNLADDAWQWGGTPDAVVTSIRDGRTAVMPPLGAATGDDAYAVSAYVYQMGGRTAAHFGAASLARGEEQYQQLCVACHGRDGKGNAALGAPDLTDGAWVYGGTHEAIRASVMQGRMGVMPPHGELLGETRVLLVAAYLLRLNQTE
ncbi:MAG: cytochrome-c oxidase, cbb3-type subunit III [Xanthomonadaceae bacterium]|nr:cytochrome-c oxidase, cbb3-type subunit III [Xanthomonadaceae bacterium]